MDGKQVETLDGQTSDTCEKMAGMRRVFVETIKTSLIACARTSSQKLAQAERATSSKQD